MSQTRETLSPLFYLSTEVNKGKEKRIGMFLPIVGKIKEPEYCEPVSKQDLEKRRVWQRKIMDTNIAIRKLVESRMSGHG